MSLARDPAGQAWTALACPAVFMRGQPPRQRPYGSMLQPASTCGAVFPDMQRPYGSRRQPAFGVVGVAAGSLTQRPYGSIRQPALLQRPWTVLRSRAQKPAGAASWVAASRGEAPDCGAPASGSAATRTRQSASAPMRRREALDIEISFPGGGSGPAGRAGRAPVFQEYGLP